MDFERYCKTAIEEYPRLCRQLQEWTEKAAGQLEDAKVTSIQKKLSLSAHDNNFFKMIGVVDVCEWKVATKRGSVTFIPDGLSIGVTGRIRVETKAKNPFHKECIFTAATEADDSKWCLVTLDASTRATSLNEARLLEAIKTIL